MLSITVICIHFLLQYPTAHNNTAAAAHNNAASAHNNIAASTATATAVAQDPIYRATHNNTIAFTRPTHNNPTTFAHNNPTAPAHNNPTTTHNLTIQVD